MYRKLLSSVREYKRPSLEAPFYVSLEVIMECIIPRVGGVDFSAFLCYHSF